MNIEVGKLYRTRHGKKARVYATDGAGDYPVHGGIFQALGWVATHWDKNGYFIDPECGEHPGDLISPWQDPKPRLLAWRHKQDGLIYLFHENNPPQSAWLERMPHLDQPEEVKS